MLGGAHVYKLLGVGATLGNWMPRCLPIDFKKDSLSLLWDESEAEGAAIAFTSSGTGIPLLS